MFIFLSEIGLQLLRESYHWYADGTFKVCPEIFYQFYTIHGQQNGQNFPILICLFLNKMLQQVFDSVGDNQLQDVLVDFERAAINGFISLTKILTWRDVSTSFHHIFGKEFNTLAFSKGTKRINSSLYIPACSVLLPLCHLITSLRVLRSSLICKGHLSRWNGWSIGLLWRNLHWPAPQKCWTSTSFACVKFMEYVPQDIWWTSKKLTTVMKDGTSVFKRKYCPVIPSFGSLLIFFELKKT